MDVKEFEQMSEGLTSVRDIEYSRIKLRLLTYLRTTPVLSFLELREKFKLFGDKQQDVVNAAKALVGDNLVRYVPSGVALVEEEEFDLA